ncbi:MAG: alpha-hydroxy acid oxidase [Amphritea sp.]
MPDSMLHKAASIADLKLIAQKRIPSYAFEYLAGGCNSNSCVQRNREALDQLRLQPQYLKSSTSASLDTEILGQQYNAPFGVAPLGLSGLIWPRASEYHATSARESNIPFILSSLASISIEEAAKFAGDNFWFQLYPPSDPKIRTDLLRRAWDSGCRHLVVTIDVPVAGRRPKDIRNGLSVPPKISPRSIWQTMQRPAWALATAFEGMPQFATMTQYMEGLSSLKDVANYIRNTFKEVVDQKMLQLIRDEWQGQLIVKGILNAEDAERALEAGANALIVSNHGGRQLDAAQTTIEALTEVHAAVGSKTTIMVDSGVESGVDIARFIASGAKMVFAGRAFMYGVGALGKHGAQHTTDLLTAELYQVMEQLRCPTTVKLPQHLKTTT